jgi:hypothetical protein
MLTFKNGRVDGAFQRDGEAKNRGAVAINAYLQLRLMLIRDAINTDWHCE